MKRLALIFALLATVVSSPASVITEVFNTGFANFGVIPDGDYSGLSDTRNITGHDGLNVVSVTVTLNISDGWNGDLYGYLTHDSGTVVLLNRAGKNLSSPFGFSNQGYDNVTVDDTITASSIQDMGSYDSTAQIADAYNSAAGTLGTTFTGTSVNGNWTLFLADLSSGDVSTLNSWSLTITAVPEPTTWAAIIFGGVFGAVQLARFRRRKA